MHLWQNYIIIYNRAIMPQNYNKNVYSPNILGKITKLMRFYLAEWKIMLTFAEIFEKLRYKYNNKVMLRIVMNITQIMAVRSMECIGERRYVHTADIAMTSIDIRK